MQLRMQVVCPQESSPRVQVKVQRGEEWDLEHTVHCAFLSHGPLDDLVCESRTVYCHRAKPIEPVHGKSKRQHLRHGFVVAAASRAASYVSTTLKFPKRFVCQQLCDKKTLDAGSLCH